VRLLWQALKQGTQVDSKILTGPLRQDSNHELTGVPRCIAPSRVAQCQGRLTA
jgi:hypothetical protein